MNKIENLSKFYLALGNNIKKFRSKRDYSQDDLARFLGMTRTSVVNIEKGRQRPPIHVLFEIAGFLNVAIGDLFPVNDEKEEINFAELENKFKLSLDNSDKEKMQHFFQLSGSK